MKKIYCKHFPLKGFLAMAIWPFVFIRKDCSRIFSEKDERHETTHILQQKECLLIAFFVVYCIEWIVKLPFCLFNTDRAYMSVSFEQEAYEHELEAGYNNVRKHFAWAKYIFTLKSKE